MIELNATEKALVSSFDAAKDGLAGQAVIGARRQELMDQLATQGLPTRRVEHWHYTDLRILLKNVGGSKSGDAKPLEPLMKGSALITVLNGESSKNDIGIDGVSVVFGHDALENGTWQDKLELTGDDDAIGQINGAFVSDGNKITVDAGAQIATPIEIQNIICGGTAHHRNTVNVGDGASITIVERIVSTQQAFGSLVNHLNVGANAKVEWILLRENGDQSDHLGQMKVNLGENADLSLMVLNAGGHLTRQEVIVDVAHEGSNLDIRGINLLGDNTHTDVTTVLYHNVENTTSQQTFRNIALKSGKGVFQGKIRVDSIAQKTDARMACNTLLLSDEADFSAKPELEIFADDVQCAHGATVTDLEDDHLFYLMARGIDEKTARMLLVKAFAAELIEELDNDELVEALEDHVESWFISHG